MILGVSFDTAAENKAFAEKFAFNFPLLCDVDRQLGLAYGAADDAKASSAKRIGVIIGADGKIKELGKADAKSFPQDALKKL